MRPGTLLRLHALQKLIAAQIHADAVVLDIGSYDGALSGKLKQLMPDLDITLLDIDEAGLELARQKGLKTVNASALEMPLANNSADIVLCLDLIEHIADDNILIKQISRVLKKQGKLILTTPDLNGVTFPFMSNQQNEAINRQWGHLRPGYSLQQLRQLLENNDIIIEKNSRYFNLLTRLVYRFCYIPGPTLPARDMWYKLATRLEPYFKFKAQEHIIIGRKI